MPTLPSRTLSVTIERPWTEVYDYAFEPTNLTHWAAGLGSDFAHDGDKWTFRDPGGNPINITFTERNALGVLDHDVHTPNGIVHMAIRVMPNGDGAEVTILLLRTPGMTDAEIERDAAAVQKDLDTLKALLERPRAH